MMRKSLLTFALLCCFAAVFGQRVRVVSYNIHHGNPPAQAGKIDLEAIAKVIIDSKADLVGLQEVDVRIPRSGGIDQAHQLAQLTGMYYFFSKGIDYDGGEYGTLILSRYPIVGNRRYELPMPESSEGRSLAIVDVALPHGRTISFANTHLDLNETNKVAQAGYINELGDWYDRPLILVGDMNAKPQSKAIQLLDTCFARNVELNGPTYPNQAPDSEIDYIMVGKHSNVVWRTYKTLSSDASDHFPLFAEIEFK
ncbi:endonuclease/exonuclease/phosphatase family protein [Sphingobacterium griseoflavum]|nr:endonuclease/exonuclease/phosphatase family protein [Sphingobacterium griseoflavum]